MKFLINQTAMSTLLLLACATLASCTSDSEIKEDLAAKAKTEIGFAGLTYTVQNKIGTLSRDCPAEESRQKVLKTDQGIAIIDSIINHIRILR
ncbi:hypothetical protein [Mucilaginibacter defluvii]|uniref:Lipoprotein n=1 Tax=Mucilaginibacter defluvii TaxID=1196019 RepID=A0ABP9FM38_9SPHI